MIALLIVVVVLGIVLEVISLRRDTSEIVADCALDTAVAEPGELFKIVTTVTNNSVLPVSYLAVREVYSTDVVLPENMPSTVELEGKCIKRVYRLKGRQRKKQSLEVSLNKRGVHIFKGHSIEFGDFLGFKEFTTYLHYRRELVVFPKKHESPELTDALGKFLGDVTAKRYLIRDPILTIGTREYTGREPMKEIHWTASAHRGELMVREFDFNRQLSVNVLLSVDGIEPWYEPGLDECCAMARSVCEELSQAGAVINFFSNSSLYGTSFTKPWRCEVSAVNNRNFLEGLGRTSSYDSGSLGQLVAFSLLESKFDDAFILILPDHDKRAESAASLLRSESNQEVLVLPVGVEQ